MNSLDFLTLVIGVANIGLSAEAASSGTLFEPSDCFGVANTLGVLTSFGFGVLRALGL